MTEILAEKTCTPCRGGIPPLTRQEAEALLAQAPDWSLVDEAHRVVHLSDGAGRFLQPSGGPVTTDAIDLVRPELRFDLRTALHRALERN